MRSIGIFPLLLWGAMACRDAPEPERAADASPYGELEVARVEEEAAPLDPSPRPRSRSVAAPPPSQPSHRDTAEPPEAAEPAATAEPAVTHESPETAQPLDTTQPPDTAGYVPYAAESPPETASTQPPDTGAVARDTAARAIAPPDPPPTETERTVPAGTAIHAALEDSIHSRIDVSGKVVAAKVMQNVTAPDGRTLIPAGTPVQLMVTQVKPGRGDRKGVLEIRAESITLGGEIRKLEATLQPVSHELRGRGVTGEEAAKVGVGAAGGAVVGRVIGGDTRGAVIGGVVGAAGGAVVASETAARDVVVKARTPVVLVLTAPLPAGS